MTSPERERLDLVLRKYNSEEIDMTYLLVYQREDTAPRAFASIHQRLDGLLQFINVKAPNGQEGHYNAEPSRELLGILDEIRNLRRALRMVGQTLVIKPDYEATLEGLGSWLMPSNGSTIPAGFTPVEVDPYAPMMWCDESALVANHQQPVQLYSIGEGAYATVQKFTEPAYGITLARKKLKSGVNDRERERFRREFELMRELRHPYILEVYAFNEQDHSYVMEFCESTLEAYVAHRNNDPRFGFETRKRIALQFLYGLNFIHSKGHFHRDLSARNVLLRVYEDHAVLVKLSDFGLAKRRGSNFTTTETEMKGTLQDPALDTFKGFGAVNDIFAAGRVLNYIFTGRKNVGRQDTAVGHLVHRCTHMDPSRRYQTVRELINAVEALDLRPQQATQPPGAH